MLCYNFVYLKTSKELHILSYSPHAEPCIKINPYGRWQGSKCSLQLWVIDGCSFPTDTWLLSTLRYNYCICVRHCVPMRVCICAGKQWKLHLSCRRRVLSHLSPVCLRPGRSLRALKCFNICRLLAALRASVRRGRQWPTPGVWQGVASV